MHQQWRKQVVNFGTLTARCIVLTVLIGMVSCERNQDSMDRAHAVVDRANELIRERRYEPAIVALKDATEINKYYIVAHYLLGWIRATCPDPQYRDGEMALQHARAAVAADLYFDQFGVTDKRARWAHHACVAAAYAELGQFDKAIEAQENALELVEYVPLEAHGIEVREIVKLRVRAALELYRAGKPLRTYKTFLSKLSDDWANAVLGATDKEQIPELAD